MKKASALLFVAILTLGIMVGFSTYTVKAVPIGEVEILKPTGSETILFYEKITVKFEVSNADFPPWAYTGAWIYVGGVKVDTTSEGYGTPFEKSYYPESYAGVTYVSVTAFFFNIFTFEEDTVSAEATFTVDPCDHTYDLEHMRIDKLHAKESGKDKLDGEGVTICIIDDLLGCDNTSREMFDKSLYRTCKNDLYGNMDRRYLDISYYKDTDSDGDFEEDWDEAEMTRLEKWEEIFEEGEREYEEPKDVHGTYCLASLRQIAPGADIVFIETNDSLEVAEDAIYWLADNYDTLGIDVVSLSWLGLSSWSDAIDDLANGGVIVVNAAGNRGENFTHSVNARYPCSFNNTIGVTGVYDSSHTNPWTRVTGENGANSGWGVDTAAIFDKMYLDWSPVPYFNYFDGTSLACPMVVGIIALLKQYKNEYKSGVTFDYELIQEFLEETGDAPGSAPSSNTTEISGYIDWINEEGSDPYYQNFPNHNYANYEYYCYGWGIIDGYEMYKYFRQNY